MSTKIICRSSIGISLVLLVSVTGICVQYEDCAHIILYFFKLLNVILFSSYVVLKMFRMGTYTILRVSDKLWDELAYLFLSEIETNQENRFMQVHLVFEKNAILKSISFTFNIDPNPMSLYYLKSNSMSSFYEIFIENKRTKYPMYFFDALSHFWYPKRIVYDISTLSNVPVVKKSIFYDFCHFLSF